MALNSLGSNAVKRGVVLVDINPNREEGNNAAILAAPDTIICSLPVQGYKKIALNRRTAIDANYLNLVDASGSTISSISPASVPLNAWSSYFDIPSNAVLLKVQSNQSTSRLIYTYSLLA